MPAPRQIVFELFMRAIGVGILCSVMIVLATGLVTAADEFTRLVSAAGFLLSGSVIMLARQGARLSAQGSRLK